MRLKILIRVWALSFLAFLVSFSSTAQERRTVKMNPSIWDTYPWEGQRGFKYSAGTTGNLFLNVSYFMSDLPKKGSANEIEGHDFVFGNQNMFAGIEVIQNMNTFDTEAFVLGPKIGYELNLVLISGRVSWVNYFNIKNGKVDSEILLESGITLMGYMGVHYGYSLNLGKEDFTEIYRHRITFSANIPRSWSKK